jgi:hypothetical protein
MRIDEQTTARIERAATADVERTTAGIERQLDREIAEVEAAIALVRSGVATAIGVANLRFGEEVLHHFEVAGIDRAVRLEPHWWPEDGGCDLDVRRADG